MYERSVRERAICVRREGWSISAIHRELSVSRAAIAAWLDDPARALEAFNRCFVCGEGEVPDAYAYLLGQYLGDGCLTTYHRVPKLRIACADDYPNIAAEVDRSLIAVSGNAVCTFQAVGCSEHATYWNHWTCLFPQHGTWAQARACHCLGAVAAGRRRGPALAVAARSDPLGRMPSDEHDSARRQDLPLSALLLQQRVHRHHLPSSRPRWTRSACGGECAVRIWWPCHGGPTSRSWTSTSARRPDQRQ
jgi:hypothetical protein